MKFEEFYQIYRKYTIIDSVSFKKFENYINLRRQVNFWLKKGYLIKLKKGIYVYSQKISDKTVNPFFVSNYLINPSYISCETALFYHKLIPEKISSFTAVTTRKTSEFINELGIFKYRNIKEDLFYGFYNIKEDDVSFFMAYPEKAIIDYFYFRKELDKNFNYFDEFRFQNLETIDIKKLLQLSEKFPLKIKVIINNFALYVKSEIKKYKSL